MQLTAQSERHNVLYCVERFTDIHCELWPQTSIWFEASPVESIHFTHQARNQNKNVWFSKRNRRTGNNRSTHFFRLYELVRRMRECVSFGVNFYSGGFLRWSQESHFDTINQHDQNVRSDRNEFASTCATRNQTCCINVWRFQSHSAAKTHEEDGATWDIWFYFYFSFCKYFIVSSLMWAMNFALASPAPAHATFTVARISHWDFSINI